MSDPNLKSDDTNLLNITTEDDQIEDLKIKTEKRDQEKFLKRLTLIMIDIVTNKKAWTTGKNFQVFEKIQLDRVQQ